MLLSKLYLGSREILLLSFIPLYFIDLFSLLYAEYALAQTVGMVYIRKINSFLMAAYGQQAANFFIRASISGSTG